MSGRSVTFVLLLAALFGVAGCALFHHGTSPQQQFLDAVQRGNSAQASQLWLTMSADDRANFAHGSGFQPTTAADDVKGALVRQQQAAEAAANADGDGDSTGSGQTVEYPGLDADRHAGSLQNLSHLATMNAAPPTPAAEGAH